MTKLIDVLTKATSVRMPGAKGEEDRVFDEAEEALDELEASLRAAKLLKRETAEPVIKKLFETLVKARGEAFTKVGRLSERLASKEIFKTETRDGATIEFRDSMLVSMNSARTVELANLREAADALGYLLLPWQYFDASTLKEEKEAAGQIERFMAQHGKDFNVFVLCPPTGYSPLFHAMDVALFRMKTWSTPKRDEHLRPSVMPVRYVGSEECYGLGLGSEVLRALIEGVEDVLLRPLQTGRDSFDDGTVGFFYNGVQLSANSHGGRERGRESLNWIRRYAVWLRLLDPKLRREQAEKQATEAYSCIVRELGTKAQELDRELDEARRARGALPIIRASASSGASLDFDPVMFAVPKQKLLIDDGEAILGPCWGPDLPKEMLALLAPFFHFEQPEK